MKTAASLSTAFRIASRDPRKHFAMVFCVFAVASAAVGFVNLGHAGTIQAIYYVSPSGSDSNTGTSASSPWKTVQKVNSSTLSQGDSVLFQGGQVFAGALVPRSGAPGAPITYGSYGTGSATMRGGPDPDGHGFDPVGIWSNSPTHDVTIRGLIFDSGRDPSTFSVRNNDGFNDWGGGTYNWTFDSDVFRNWFNGLNIGANSSNYTITNSTFDRMGLNGVVFNRYNPTGGGQSGLTFTGNTVSNWGLDSHFSEGKHGIYSNWTRVTIAGNTIHDSNGGSGVSVRFPDVRIIDNTIYNTNTGISYYDYSPSFLVGQVTIAYNRISNVAGGIWIDRNANDGTADNHQNFVIVNNDIRTTNKGITDTGYGVIGINYTSGSVRVASNIMMPFPGQMQLRLDSMPGGGFSEQSDWFDTASASWRYLGTTYGSFGSYRSASSQGAGDLNVSVSGQISSDSSMAPSSTSPGIDRGTISVNGATWTASCSSDAFTYCGAAPDIGAVEFVSSPSDSVAPAAPTGLTVGATDQQSSTISWASSTDNIGVTGYTLYRGTLKIGTTTKTVYTFTQLACGTAYTLGVAAFDAAGNASGTKQISTTTAACTTSTPSDTVAPSAPTGLTVGATDQQSSTISWAPSTDNIGVTGYTLYRNGSQAATTTSTSYTYTQLACGTAYTLGIAAFDAAGNASGIRQVSTTTAACSTQLHTTPTVVIVSPTTDRIPSAFAVAASATDPRGITGMSVLLDGVTLCTTYSAQISCPIALTSPGWHAVDVRATNGDGATGHTRMDVRINRVPRFYH